MCIVASFFTSNSVHFSHSCRSWTQVVLLLPRGMECTVRTKWTATDRIPCRCRWTLLLVGFVGWKLKSKSELLRRRSKFLFPCSTCFFFVSVDVCARAIICMRTANSCFQSRPCIQHRLRTRIWWARPQWTSWTTRLVRSWFPMGNRSMYSHKVGQFANKSNSEKKLNFLKIFDWVAVWTYERMNLASL